MSAFLGFEVTQLLASEFLSACLAFVIAYLMFRSFRVLRSDYLLGFPIGFSFLGLSYLLLGASYVISSLGDEASWLQLFIGCYGFAFLGTTYFLRRRSLAHRLGKLSNWLFSLLVVLAVVAVLIVVVPPVMVLPPHNVAEQVIRITNLGLLTYVLLSMYRILKAKTYELGAGVLAGFVFLAIEQYSLLLWSLDAGFWSFALAHLSRLLGLGAIALEGFHRQ
jgi:hypothetical protein